MTDTAFNVFELSAKIGLDTKEYEEKLKSSEKSSHGFMSVLKAVGGQSDTLKNKIAVLAEQHQSAKDKVKELTKEFNASVKENGAAS